MKVILSVPIAGLSTNLSDRRQKLLSKRKMGAYAELKFLTKKLEFHALELEKYPVKTGVREKIYLEFGKYSEKPSAGMRNRLTGLVLDTELETIQKVLSYAIKFFKKESPTWKEDTFAKTNEIVERGWGSCASRATVAASFLRELGIPTRLVYGAHVVKEEPRTHAWVECYFPKNKWVPLEPFTQKVEPSQTYVKLMTLTDWDRADFSEYARWAAEGKWPPFKLIAYSQE